MASGTFEWSEKAQNGLKWFQKYFYPVASYMFRYLYYPCEVLDYA